MLRDLMRLLPRGRQRLAHRLATGSRIFNMGWPLSGLRMYLDANDPFQAEMVFGVYQLDLMRELSRLVKPGDIVLTVGAHVGYVVLALAKLVGPTGKVIGCECDPNLIDQCEFNLRLNTVSAQIVPVALGSEKGELEMNLSTTAGQSSFSIPHHMAEKRLMALRTGDDVLKELSIDHLGGLFLDVEGWESHVLQGLAETLDRQLPRWAVIECFDVALENAGSSGKRLRSQIEALGWVIEKNLSNDLILSSGFQAEV